jgi:hypothetical protein
MRTTWFAAVSSDINNIQLITAVRNAKLSFLVHIITYQGGLHEL